MRLLTIAGTLARHDALFVFDWLPGAQWVGRVARLIWRRRDGSIAGLRPGERLALALVGLGPSFIKLGQALSTRSDLVGEEMAADLSRLQDRLPPFPSAAARATIEAELGQDIDSLFAQFEDEPVAAASIAQVHFATTRNEDGTAGQDVAVKVLRPDIEQAFERDLVLFRWVAELTERTQPRLRRLKPVETIETFAETVRHEMDLRMEAAAASELAENFADDETYRVPAVDWVRTARRVLTTQRIIGIPLHDVEALAEAGHDLEEIVRRSAAAFFNQVFRDGFFHGDMHPGNLFVDADGALVAVDFGIMGRLDRKTRHFLADMLLGFLTQDYARVADVHFDAGYVPRNQSRERFMQAARAIAEPIFGRPSGEISVARLLAQLFLVTEQFEMETQPQLLLLQKTMMLAEGVGRTLAPHTNMWALAQPLVEQWMRRHRGPEARLMEAVRELVESLRAMPALVTNLERAAAKMADGSLRLEVHDGGQASGRWLPWAMVAMLTALVGVLLAAS
ncbi:MAG: 2-polyprenylphenol 6-hydroxylase [Alphaproteobacteria bacterium]